MCIPSNSFCFKDVRVSLALLPLAMQEMSTLEEKLIRIMRFTGISVTGFFLKSGECCDLLARAKLRSI